MMSIAALDFGASEAAVLEFGSPMRGRDLRSRVHQALQRGEQHVVVDCKEWGALDFSTLSSLIQCASLCRQEGAAFEVTNLSNTLRANIRALRLNERLGLAE
jgi:anti-anti-sigma regulatory factor